MDMGVVGPRSTVAFLHTVLRENVLPAIAVMSKRKQSYSPTLGGYFRMYSSSGRRHSFDFVDDSQQNESVAGREDSIHKASGWLRRSPSSFFLFGDESNSANMSDSLSFTGTLLRGMKDSFLGNRLFGHETKISSPIEDKTREHTTYLQMLDMYGSDADKMIRLLRTG
jgi:hypothetical protein